MQTPAEAVRNGKAFVAFEFERFVFMVVLMKVNDIYKAAFESQFTKGIHYLEFN